MSDQYTLAYTPERFFHRKNFTTMGTVPYWEVITNKGIVFAICDSEMKAVTVCMALELMATYTLGDGAANREILSQLSKLRN